MAKEPSVIEQLKKLDEQRTALIEGAKKAALEKASEAIEELNELGFRYSLQSGATSKAARAPAKASGDGTKRVQKDIPCPVCSVKTAPLHDRRAHRGQTPPRPFTAEEMQAKNLTVVQ